MLGDIETAAGQHKHAIDRWKKIEHQDPKYLPLVAERLLLAYRKIEEVNAGISLLQDYQAKYPSHDLMNVLFQAVLQRDGAEAASQLVRNELQRNPTLLGLDKFLEARLLEVTEKNRADVALVKNLVHQRTRALAMYYCSSCGFKARQFYWHCPACHGWETYSPRRSEENGLMI